MLLINPVLAIIGLLLLPFLSGEGEKSCRRRPIAVLTISLIANSVYATLMERFMQL